MLIVDNAYLLPGYCIHCKTKGGRRFIQTDILIENFGTIYICETCFEEIHRTLDVEFPNRLRGYELRIERLEEENERLRSALALLDFIPNRSRDNFSPDENGKEDSSGTPEKRTGTKSGPAKSSPKQGPSGVRGSKLTELLGADS